MEHRRFHSHQKRGDPFSGIENGLSSLAAAANSIFGGGSGAAPTAGSSAGNSNNGNGGNGQGGEQGGSNASANPATSKTAASNPAPSSAANNGNGGNGGNGGNNGPSTVYVTATWTGTGSYSLSTVKPDPTSTIAPSSTPPSKQTTADPEPSPSTTLQKSRKSSATQVPSTSSDPAAAASSSLSTSAALSASTAAASALSLATSASTSAQAAATTGAIALGAGQNAGGLSAGAKAGIAIGVILGILALVAGAFALYRWKKNRDENAFENLNSSEKNPFSDTAALNMGQSRAATPPPVRTSTLPAAASSNPFGSGATQMAPTSVSMNGFPSGNKAALAGAAGAAGIAGAAIGANAARANPPPQLNVIRSQSPALVAPPAVAPSPVGSTFSESSTMVAGMAGGVGGAASPRMHRVQMDFNPTMDDELKIAVGEIVRIVREFDDGWCSVEIVQRDGQGNVLRHQQGVVPRTCLSRLPLKPRQKRPAPPGAVPTAPQMANLTQPMGSPNPGRIQSPAMGPNPTGRSMSPGPYGGSFQERSQQPANRARSNSANDINGRARAAGPGPSRMNPAAQNGRPVELPIQSQSMSAMPNVAPANHDRNLSGGSTNSAPVARKPVPGNPDA